MKIDVVAAIIVEHNKVLATQRANGDFKGQWEFPGGKVETNETNVNALIREIKEELNIDIDINGKLCNVNYQYPKFYISMECYICRIKSGEIKLNDHKDYKWLARNELFDVKWLPADVEVVMKLDEYLSSKEL
ncbi:MAG: (deoxy)nucleoside triphosphate pyrophosphohydrolase [Erysipelotrichaceae bacterium]|nr:(deoxy)nucleoside triphosphate pyrophosphohydrolase [Erysipelotrichaceae bacterium]